MVHCRTPGRLIKACGRRWLANINTVLLPLPTPSNARMVPSSQYIHSSSKPTPTKSSTIRPPQPTYGHFPSTQPTSCRHTKEPPLYKFSLGTHRGKTLLEVLEKHIACLRVNQDTADSMPGLAAVLRLYDASQPPVGPLPPPSSPRISKDAPSSSTPLLRSASQPARLTTLPPTLPLLQAHRFDFGIHAGNTLAEVPSSYLAFLKLKGIVDGKPALAVAINKHEREIVENVQNALRRHPSPTPHRFVLRFGKYQVKTMEEVHSDYIAWLKSSTTMMKGNDNLPDAIKHHEQLKGVSRANPKPRSYGAFRSYLTSQSHPAVRADPPLYQSSQLGKRKRTRVPTITYSPLTTAPIG
jgi:uncharacterized protein (DUF3820 family)